MQGKQTVPVPEEKVLHVKLLLIVVSSISWVSCCCSYLGEEFDSSELSVRFQIWVETSQLLSSGKSMSLPPFWNCEFFDVCVEPLLRCLKTHQARSFLINFHLICDLLQPNVTYYTLLITISEHMLLYTFLYIFDHIFCLILEIGHLVVCYIPNIYRAPIDNGRFM